MKLEKRVILFLSLLLTVVILSGCTLFSAKSGRLIAKVTMGDGETPINAKVFLGDKEVATADKDGKFSLVLKPGKYNVHAEFQGKSSQAQAIEIKNGAINELKEPLKVTGLAILTGTVKTSDEKPLVGASVTLGAVSNTVDKDGKYYMVVLPGEQVLKVTYKGFSKTVNDTYDMPAETIKEEKLTIAELAERSLTLKNDKGEGHAAINATIKLGAFEDTVKTNGAGLLSFIAPAGSADVAVNLLLAGTDHSYSFTKTAVIGTATELKFDVNDKRLFYDNFTGTLTKWVGEEAWDLNAWAMSKPAPKVVNGVLTRDFEPTEKGSYTSGLKIKDLEITDAIVIVKARTTEVRQGVIAGLRIQVRNNASVWADGYALNASTGSFDLANWTWYGHDQTPKFKKTSPVTPPSSQPLFTEDGTWVTAAVVVQGNTLKYYKNGALINQMTETDANYFHTKGGVFIEFNGGIEIDEISVYNY